jgi:hypothetical protein
MPQPNIDQRLFAIADPFVARAVVGEIHAPVHSLRQFGSGEPIAASFQNAGAGKVCARKNRFKLSQIVAPGE